MTTMLTEHFSIEELVHSDTAIAMGNANMPDTEEQAKNLLRLAETLEKVREILGVRMHITSGYRNNAVNARVGGVQNSAHLTGLAADFVAPAFGPPLDICRRLEPHMDALDIDQLICERLHGSQWVHLGLSSNAPRMMAFTMTDRGNMNGFA